MKDKDMEFGMNRNLERIDREQEARLDGLLEQPAQQALARMVAALPQEEPSLAWRSAVSERVFAAAKANARKRRIAWTLRPALGLGLGAAMALAFISTQMQVLDPPVASASVEEQILSAHRESVQVESFWGGVRTGEEAIAVSAPAVQEYQWDETDLGTL